MDVATEAQLAPLTAALEKKPIPYCGGTLSIPEEHFTLFYGKIGSAERLELNNATEAQLQNLANACDPATFGRNKEDVLDESYRKAGKMDSNQFAMKLGDGTIQRILDIIHPELLRGYDGSKSIVPELYKLNVYQKGSFFKAHKDTPRSETMFGSLVITFPTQHEGGVLILRHDDQAWTHDPSTLLLPLNDQEPRIAYIAFFGDVEHEVSMVTAGHRVTLTYNLYYGDACTSATALAEAEGVTRSIRPDEEAFRLLALQNALEDPTFLPNGGTLGFGLAHQYALSQDTWMDDMIDNLKGSDAILLEACEEAGLTAETKLFYQGDGCAVLADCAVSGEYDQVEHVVAFLCAGNTVIKLPKRSKRKLDAIVNWVTQPNDLAEVDSPIITYGNSADLNHAYGRMCLIATVDSYEERTNVTDETDELA